MELQVELQGGMQAPKNEPRVLVLMSDVIENVALHEICYTVWRMPKTAVQ